MRIAAALPAMTVSMLTACVSPAPTIAPAPVIAHVTGTVSYPERMALPQGSIVQVVLEDVSLADAPAKLISVDSILTNRQPPIPFKIAFDANAIDPKHRYTVRAGIADAEGKLRWASTEAHPVITLGNPQQVEIVVHRIGP